MRFGAELLCCGAFTQTHRKQKQGGGAAGGRATHCRICIKMPRWPRAVVLRSTAEALPVSEEHTVAVWLVVSHAKRRTQLLSLLWILVDISSF